MYGLPEDLDLSFFVGTTLIQLGVGEHQIAFVLHPDVRLAVESTMRLFHPDAPTVTIDDYRSSGGVLLPLISHDVRAASRTASGSLRLEWSTGAALEVDDDSETCESYTINHRNRLIVV
ncbi:MAG TPA: DUF6188 family protein [Gaiellales bacterium]|nr:DUF6188 family protein [Gaiellales bacterium]